MSKVLTHRVWIDSREPAKLHVKIEPNDTFKAVYLLWWEEGTTPRPRPTLVDPHQYNAQILVFTLPETLPFDPHSRTPMNRTATVTVKNTGPVEWNEATVKVSLTSGNSVTWPRPLSKNVPSGSTATFDLLFGCSKAGSCSVKVQMESHGVTFGNSMTEDTECERSDSQ